MRLRAVAIVIALLLTPGASAGSEIDPDIMDRGRDVPASNADILAAWFDGEARGLRFSIRTVDGSLPERFPDIIYWFTFTIDSTGQEAAAVVGFGDDGVFRGHLETGDRNGGLDDRGTAWTTGVPFERAANGALVGLREERGRPSTWSAIIPWGAVDGFESGVTLTGLLVGSTFYDRAARQWTGAADTAATSEPFVAEAPVGPLSLLARTFPIIVPSWALPVIVGTCALAGLGAGFAGARLVSRAPAPQPVATTVPVRPGPPPPGDRFQTSPSAKR